MNPMRCIAAVTTGKGAGAISTIELYGQGSEKILRKLFESRLLSRCIGTRNDNRNFITGKIYLGDIKEDDRPIDQVIIGCEGEDHFAIHCHGNPLITSKITKLLNSRGVDILTDKQFKAVFYKERNNFNSIEVEAKLAVTEAKTTEGTKLAFAQVDGGLTKIVAEWLEELDSCFHRSNKCRKNDKNTDSQQILERIKSQAKKILDNSKIARTIIYGLKAVLTGPPNSGKSTLLNTLVGKEKVIVTDISGTTRDWVSAECLVGSLSVEFIDTAGLDEKIAAKSHSDSQAQLMARQLLESAGIVLFVVDGNRSQIDVDMFTNIKANKILVLNKSDLGIKVRKDLNFPHIVEISARKNIGLDNLKNEIVGICGTENFDLASPVCFTPRQEKLLTALLNDDRKEIARSVITELSNGKIVV